MGGRIESGVGAATLNHSGKPPRGDLENESVSHTEILGKIVPGKRNSKYRKALGHKYVWGSRNREEASVAEAKGVRVRVDEAPGVAGREIPQVSWATV